MVRFACFSTYALASQTLSDVDCHAYQIVSLAAVYGHDHVQIWCLVMIRLRESQSGAGLGLRVQMLLSHATAFRVCNVAG